MPEHLHMLLWGFSVSNYSLSFVNFMAQQALHTVDEIFGGFFFFFASIFLNFPCVKTSPFIEQELTILM